MSILSSLLVAIDMAKRQRDDAGHAVARVQRSYDSARDQMDQLQSYAADTESRWAVASRASTTPEIVQHYYQFMDRLQQAIDLQRSAMAELHGECLKARRCLLDAEVRIAGLNRILDRRRAATVRLQAAREQKLSDEFASVRHLRAARDMQAQEKP